MVIMHLDVLNVFVFQSTNIKIKNQDEFENKTL